MLLPLAFIAGLAAFLALPRIHDNPILAASFAGAVAVLLVWYAILWRRTRARGTRLTIDISLRPQHYLQAIAHTLIFVYWGMYWPPLRDAAPLIAAQIVFAYAFDMLLSWTRKDEFVLGFGPFPIIYSTNLFLRFRDDWFYLQFLMVAVGFLAKELIRWQRDGRRVHIFNPSSFPLALFSFALIATGTTAITWGEDIANLLILPPQIYLFIFLVALPGQFMFRVTTMTLPAVATTYLCSEIYLRTTGTYLFFDSNVPIAVFLGMHLLFTDPSTSPKTELGRVIFGVIYGLTVVGLYVVLGAMGLPTFYDKLLQVPFMNAAVRAIDRLAQRLSWADPARLGATLRPQIRSFVYVTTWILVFSAMSAARGLGDRHPGTTVPFWDRACSENRDGACNNEAILLSQACRANSGWACNRLGILVAEGRVVAAPAADLFNLACKDGFPTGCENAARGTTAAGSFKEGDPGLRDYVQLLRGGKAPLDAQRPFDVLERACNGDWPRACGNLAQFYYEGNAVAVDKARAAALLATACDAGSALSCSNVALMYFRGDGVAANPMKSSLYLEQSCTLGLESACQVIRQRRNPSRR